MKRFSHVFFFIFIFAALNSALLDGVSCGSSYETQDLEATRDCCGTTVVVYISNALCQPGVCAFCYHERYSDIVECENGCSFFLEYTKAVVTDCYNCA